MFCAANDCFCIDKYGFNWFRFELNISVFVSVLLGAYGVVLRCRHKVTEALFPSHSSAMTVNQIYRSTCYKG